MTLKISAVHQQSNQQTSVQLKTMIKKITKKETFTSIEITPMFQKLEITYVSKA